MTLEGGVRRGVGPRLLVLMVRLLVLLYVGALIHWMQGSISPLTIHSTILVAEGHLHGLDVKIDVQVFV